MLIERVLAVPHLVEFLTHEHKARRPVEPFCGFSKWHFGQRGVQRGIEHFEGAAVQVIAKPSTAPGSPPLPFLWSYGSSPQQIGCKAFPPVSS